MTVLSNDATLESDRLSDLEHELADHKREACILTGQVLTLEQYAERFILPSLADKVKVIETGLAALHEVQVPLRAVPMELVARAKAAESKIQTAMAGLPPNLTAGDRIGGIAKVELRRVQPHVGRVEESVLNARQPGPRISCTHENRERTQAD